MIFYLSLDGDTLTLSDYKTRANTGNVNSYICKFSLDSHWDGLNIFSTFKSGDKVFTMALSDDQTAVIPHELLTDSGEISVGIFATNFSDTEFIRISSNMVNISVNDGAYKEASTAPKIPTPDYWEELTGKLTPKIGENGNWFIFDMTSREYRDTKVSARGEIDLDFNEDSKNPLSNDVISKRFRDIDENHFTKSVSDSRYLFKKNIITDFAPIKNVDDYIPNAPILDCKIMGISYTDTDPTLGNPQTIYSVGDQVIDEENEHFGQYHIPYNFCGTNYNLYLNEPLRGVMHYGTNNINLIGVYDYTSDCIDFKNKCLIRNVGELIIDDISTIDEFDGICNLSKENLWVRSVLKVPDMTLSHPSGKWVEGDVLSTHLQVYKKNFPSVIATDSYIMTTNGDNNLYFYWDMARLGFSFEPGDENDYLVKTTSNSRYKIKDENSEYLTDFSKITQKIKELYAGESVTILYPLASSKIEPLELPTLYTPESGNLSLDFDSSDYPREINLTYYADTTANFISLNDKIEKLESAILSLGADIS